MCLSTNRLFHTANRLLTAAYKREAAGGKSVAVTYLFIWLWRSSCLLSSGLILANFLLFNLSYLILLSSPLILSLIIFYFLVLFHFIFSNISYFILSNLVLTSHCLSLHPHRLSFCVIFISCHLLLSPLISFSLDSLVSSHLVPLLWSHVSFHLFSSLLLVSVHFILSHLICLVSSLLSSHLISNCLISCSLVSSPLLSFHFIFSPLVSVYHLLSNFTFSHLFSSHLILFCLISSYLM